MENKQLETLLAKQPTQAIVTCKTGVVKGKREYKIKYGFERKAPQGSLTEEEKARFLSLYQENPKKMMEELALFRFHDKPILEVYRGSASAILPAQYRRFYQKCTLLRANNYSIYFVDEAIEAFRDTIFLLDKKSRQDSLQLVQEKLTRGESKNLCLSILDGYSWSRGRKCSFEKESPFQSRPKNALYYSTDLKEDGKVPIEDIQDMEKMIATFASSYGQFEEVEVSREECVAYNQGSLKIEGIHKYPKLLKKVYSSMKKEGM